MVYVEFSELDESNTGNIAYAAQDCQNDGDCTGDFVCDYNQALES